MSRNTKPSKKPSPPGRGTLQRAPTTRQDQKSLTLGELARSLGGRVVGNKGIFIRGVMTIDEAREGDITFIANEKYSKKLATTRASAVIVSPEFQAVGAIRLRRTVAQKNRAGTSPAPTTPALLVTENPYLAFARAVDLFKPEEVHPKGIHPTATICPTARLGQEVSIYPRVFVGERTRLGDRAVIMPNVYVGEDCQIGEDTILYPNVVIYAGTVIGKRVRIHSNTVIGSSGFGFAPEEEGYFPIHQVGNTILEDEVEIGANTTIQRGALGATRIGRGTKIGSQVQIAHNVEIGENTLLIGQVGIAGSAKIGSRVILAGGVGVVGHVTVGDDVKVGARSGVTNDLPSGGTYLGYPAEPIKKMRRTQVAMHRLPAMMELLRSLKRQIAEIEKRPPK
ncbi:MAG TPA: UDP-3-O-(3-hydroxymyristoyl)glucosamine N-acyltransferase [Candidatus Brocadiales bacterium]|nr:UDP-3-O-(3-hydroxymyristoyl)glucosamine N-acyltransferase [Candidatus Brocadiales bacterium]